MSTDKTLEAFATFAARVKEKLAPPILGEPEDQLRAPFENLIVRLGEIGRLKVQATGEVALSGGLGRPDYAVTVGGALAGYVELKAPGKGADTSRYKGHDERQWKKFSAIPNILYTDGNDWRLYRSGEFLDGARLSGDIERRGALAVEEKDVRALFRVLTQFMGWTPQVPAEFKQMAAMLAPLCRLLRDDISEALLRPDSKLTEVAQDWRKLLFPEASDDRFADAYAQTVTFALLLARLDGADVTSLDAAAQNLKVHHGLLSRALQILTDNEAMQEIAPAVLLLQRTIAAIAPQLSTGDDDPWLYFYEDFLAAYDEKLRKDFGVYYTPVEVVRCQVRLIDEWLRTTLKKPLGFASEGVITLDPAVGTGTYPLGVINHALKTIEKKQGRGAVAGHAATLAKNLYAFEFMVGPYAVADLRLTRALADRGATLPDGGLAVYLTDTLESPHAEVLDLPQYLRPISDQHKKALQVKKNIPVLVCLGNPPYDRHAAAKKGEHGSSGNWVRYGHEKDGRDAILQDFIRPAQAAGLGVHIKNIYNLYVYFWRWAFWKVFESGDAAGAGVVSFITASSYLVGQGFAGMRMHMRQVCDEIWIIDLGGEGRGADADANVFNIQTPVAIGIAFRKGNPNPATPAPVHYARLEGSRADKLRLLDGIKSHKDLEWETCPNGWLDKFVPISTGDYAEWPQIVDLFPWQQPGVKAGRTWVISHDSRVLEARWRCLATAVKKDKKSLFKDSPSGRQTQHAPAPLRVGDNPAGSIDDTTAQSPSPQMSLVAYRSFDRQFVVADSRVLDRQGPPLWHAHSDRQCYLTSLLTSPLGSGPAMTVAAHVPDLHYFSGRGAKDAIPLYRDSGCAQANIAPGLMASLKSNLGAVSPEDFFAYVYGVLAQPGFTRRFSEDQKRSGLRVPVTRDKKLFRAAVKTGRHLFWLHTYGERFVPDGQTPGEVPQGKARCVQGVPNAPGKYPVDFAHDGESLTLRVGEGEFAPVSPDVWAFEVSGLRVVRSWLGYRMKERKGKKSSPLDEIGPERWTAEFTTELLHLLWILEATVAGYAAQEKLLADILAGPLYTEAELWPMGAMKKNDLLEPFRKPPSSHGPQAELEL